MALRPFNPIACKIRRCGDDARHRRGRAGPWRTAPADGGARRRGRATRHRARTPTRANRVPPPVGGAPPADLRGRPARVPDVPGRDADRRLHHAGVRHRPDPHPPPHPRGARGAHGPRRRAEPPIDAGPLEPGRVTHLMPARRRPDSPLRPPPQTPRAPAGPFGVRGHPAGASDQSPRGAPRTWTDVPAARTRPARDRRPVAARHAALARSAIAPYAPRIDGPPGFKFLFRSAAISAPAVTPSGWRSGRSGWTRHCSRPRRTGARADRGHFSHW